MPFRRKLSALFLITSLASPLFAASDVDDNAVRQGLAHIYNLDYDAARAVFDRLIARDPGNPFGPYGLTMVNWWELTNEFDEKNPELEKRFLKAVNDTIAAAEKRAKDDPDGVARLCWGGALGLRGRWDAIQGHWLKAYKDGKAAFRLQQEALRDNPEMYDAELGLGIFHYYTATLPKVVKFLARFVFGESTKAEGLKEIQNAAAKSRYSQTAAQLFLVGIYTNTEKKHAEALKIVRDLRTQYPTSSFFHFLNMLVLENAGDWKTLRNQSNEFLALCGRDAPSYRATYLHRGFLLLADSYLLEGDAAEAVKRYNDVLNRFSADDRWITLTYLNRGKASDLLGKREEALGDYRAVLKRRDVWQLHDLAKKYIDKPYVKGDAPAHL